MPCYSIAEMLRMASQAGYSGAARLEIVAHALVESSGCSDAYNPSGAAGILQFLPSTAAEVGLRDPYDAQSSFDASYRLSGGSNFGAWTPYEPAAAYDKALDSVRKSAGGTDPGKNSTPSSDPTGIGKAISDAVGYTGGQLRAAGTQAGAGLQLGVGFVILAAGAAVLVFVFLQRTDAGRGIRRAGGELGRAAVMVAK